MESVSESPEAHAGSHTAEEADLLDHNIKRAKKAEICKGDRPIHGTHLEAEGGEPITGGKDNGLAFKDVLLGGHSNGQSQFSGGINVDEESKVDFSNVLCL